MRSWPVALAFFASTTASAGFFTPSIDRDALYDFEGSISLEGQIEVPLYRPFTGSAQPCVEVVLDDGSVHLFDINLAQSGVTVTAAFAEAAGSEVKEVKYKGFKGSTAKVAKDLRFSIGGASFSGILATVASGPIGEQSNSPFFSGGGVPRAGSIGIAGFSELAGTLDRTNGVLRLAPASEGESLLNGLEGGSQVAYTSLPSATHEFDEKTKHFSPPTSIVLEATYGDNDVTVAFSTKMASTLNDRVSAGYEVIHVGSKRIVASDISVSEIIEGILPVGFSAVPDHIEGRPDLLIGQAAQTEWDIAWSPSNGAVSIRQASGAGASDYFEQASAQLLESMNTDSSEEEAAESGDAESPQEDSATNPHAATYKSLAELALWAGDHENALEYAQKAADEEDCVSHLMTGSIQVMAGNLAAAQEAYAASWGLYSPWDALDLETRKELQEEAQDDQPKPQNAACFQAEGLHALAAAAAGNSAALADVEIGMQEMSHLPALGVANAKLAEGDSQGALAAYLQVARLNRMAAWSGLGLAQLGKGQPDNAIGNLEQAVWHQAANLELARHYVTALTTRRGSDFAAKTIGELAAQLPTNGTWHLAHAEALAAAGLDNSEALAKAEEHIQRDILLLNNAESMGLFAHAKIARGDLTIAKAVANRAVNQSMFAPTALTALAAVSVAEGDLESAKSYLRRAAAGGDPAFVALLAVELQAPAVDTEAETDDAGE